LGVAGGADILGEPAALVVLVLMEALAGVGHGGEATMLVAEGDLAANGIHDALESVGLVVEELGALVVGAHDGLGQAARVALDESGEVVAIGDGDDAPLVVVGEGAQ